MTGTAESGGEPPRNPNFGLSFSPFAPQSLSEKSIVQMAGGGDGFELAPRAVPKWPTPRAPRFRCAAPLDFRATIGAPLVFAGCDGARGAEDVRWEER